MKPTFKATNSEQLIHEIAMPIFVARGSQVEFASGTAFVIGRGWALTAYHVIDDIVKRYGSTIQEDGSIKSECELVTYLTLDKGMRYFPLRILRIWHKQPLDLAVLALGGPSDWPKDHVWKIPAISLLPPKKGTPVVAFGFANSEIEHPSGELHPTALIHPRTATGEVIEIHHELRDSGRLRFPCFRVNARFDAGMSGGPVIDNLTGHVCGAICSSLPATRDDEDHVSYASSLWPVVATQVDVTAETVAGGDFRPLIELYSSQRLFASDIERVRIIQDVEGKPQVQAAYDSVEWDNPKSLKGKD